VRNAIALVMACSIFVVYSTCDAQALSFRLGGPNAILTATTELAVESPSTQSSSQDSGQTRVIEQRNLSNGTTEQIIQDSSGTQWRVKGFSFSFQVPGVNSFSQISEADRQTAMQAAQIFAALNDLDPDEHQDKVELESALNKAGDFEAQASILKQWLEHERSNRNLSELEGGKTLPPDYDPPEYHQPSSQDWGNWFLADGKTPRKLIHSSDWGRARVGSQFHGLEGLIGEVCVVDQTSGQKVLNMNNLTVQRFLASAGILDVDKTGIQNALQTLCSDPSDRHQVGESIELPGSVENPCYVYILENMGGEGAQKGTYRKSTYEVYDKCNDPKHYPPVKGVPITVNGTTYWFAEVCANPVIILQSKGRLRLRVEVKLQIFKKPSFKPRTPFVPTVSTPPSGLVPQEEADIQCFASDPAVPQSSDMIAGGTYRFDAAPGTKVLSGNIYVRHDLNNKRKDLLPTLDGRFLRETTAVRELIPASAGGHEGAVGYATDMVKGSLVADITIGNLAGTKTRSCQVYFDAFQKGSHWWVWVIVGFAAGVVFCVATKVCGSNTQIIPVPTPSTPSTGPKGAGSPDPGGTRQQHQ